MCYHRFRVNIWYPKILSWKPELRSPLPSSKSSKNENGFKKTPKYRLNTAKGPSRMQTPVREREF